jgi:hypothetical protein
VQFLFIRYQQSQGIQQTHVRPTFFSHVLVFPPPSLVWRFQFHVFFMSRPNTRPKNKDMHPGIVDLSPQRRMHAQKKANDDRSTEERQAREEAHKLSIRHLAEVEERTTQRHNMVMAPGSGPRTLTQKKDHGRSETAPRTADTSAEESGKRVHD